MNWTPLHLHSHFSLLYGLSQPKDIAERCSALGYKSCAITDHGNISGAISFQDAMIKKGIKPILGIKFYICEKDSTVHTKENRSLHHIIILAKNEQGWKDLIAAVSEANKKENYYDKPRLDLQKLAKFCTNNWIVFSGHIGSNLANIYFANQDVTVVVQELVELFGKHNVFIAIQLIDKENIPQLDDLADKLREVSKIIGLSCIATVDSCYCKKEDAEDHRVILCSGMKTTIRKFKDKIQKSEDVALTRFFTSDNYHIPTVDELLSVGHTLEEIENTNLIANMCEEYNLLSKPKLPQFVCSSGLTQTQYLKELCTQGWNKRNKKEWDDEIYNHRLEEELQVFKKAQLEGYFLIVQDYVNYAKNLGWLVGPGRGSVGGSLVAYLLGIIEINPIQHQLLFARFYNEGRNTDTHISLPDIDIDFPISKRSNIINYIKNKYGHDKVSQMVTFGRLQGKGAIKEVLRIHEACDHATSNLITKHIPAEHEISDQMQNDEEISILRWVLINKPEILAEYCQIDENGNLTGDYAIYFEQAIRLEGTYKTQSKHAAGIIIASEPLSQLCPMIYDKHGDELIAGMDMYDLEKIGLPKFDILGVAALDKLMGINDLLEYGYIKNEN